MPLVDHIKRRLTGMVIWLSYGERVQLINLAPHPSYLFYVCSQVTTQIIEIFDRARRHCLWRKVTDRDARAHSLAAWDLVCHPKNKGGLGIINTRLQNIALMCKWIWKLSQGAKGLWADILRAKYFPNGNFFDGEARGSPLLARSAGHQTCF